MNELGTRHCVMPKVARYQERFGFGIREVSRKTGNLSTKSKARQSSTTSASSTSKAAPGNRRPLFLARLICTGPAKLLICRKIPTGSRCQNLNLVTIIKALNVAQRC